MEKRSVVLSGHATSVALEPTFWRAIERLATIREISVAALVADVDANRKTANLASALRCFVLRQAVQGNLGTGDLD